jgi:hypothetical protein
MYDNRIRGIIKYIEMSRDIDDSIKKYNGQLVEGNLYVLNIQGQDVFFYLDNNMLRLYSMDYSDKNKYVDLLEYARKFDTLDILNQNHRRYILQLMFHIESIAGYTMNKDKEYICSIMEKIVDYKEAVDKERVRIKKIKERIIDEMDRFLYEFKRDHSVDITDNQCVKFGLKQGFKKKLIRRLKSP